MSRTQNSFDVESLEPRQLFDAAHPTLIAERLLGTLPVVTGVVLTFDGPLDAASAQNKLSYHLYRNQLKYERHSQEGIDNPYSKIPILRLRVPFSSAVYDDAAHTVTLTPRDPFRAG